MRAVQKNAEDNATSVWRTPFTLWWGARVYRYLNCCQVPGFRLDDLDKVVWRRVAENNQ